MAKEDANRELWHTETDCRRLDIAQSESACQCQSHHPVLTFSNKRIPNPFYHDNNSIFSFALLSNLSDKTSPSSINKSSNQPEFRLPMPLAIQQQFVEPNLPPRSSILNEFRVDATVTGPTVSSPKRIRFQSLTSEPLERRLVNNRRVYFKLFRRVKQCQGFLPVPHVSANKTNRIQWCVSERRGEWHSMMPPS